jgi:DNA-binding response OmpR family regulator
MKKILLIEDLKKVRNLVAQILSMYGFEVLEAENGLEGLNLAKKEIPDLIISDCQMPVMEGIQVLEEIRKNKSTAGIPFIFLSGNISERSIIRGKELGVSAFIPKPFNPEELIEAINKVFAG